MSIETLIAEIVALKEGDPEPDYEDLAQRHEVPVEVVHDTINKLVMEATYHSTPLGHSAFFWRWVDKDTRR